MKLFRFLFAAASLLASVAAFGGEDVEVAANALADEVQTGALLPQEEAPRFSIVVADRPPAALTETSSHNLLPAGLALAVTGALLGLVAWSRRVLLRRVPGGGAFDDTDTGSSSVLKAPQQLALDAHASTAVEAAWQQHFAQDGYKPLPKGGGWFRRFFGGVG